MEEKNIQIDSDEITLKELILRVQEYFWEVIRNWKTVVLLTFLVMAFMFYRTYARPVSYPAKLTFMMNEDQGGGMSSFGGILSPFLGGNFDSYNLSKIHALLRSRNIIQQALFEKSEIKNKTDFYANHIIYQYEFHELWKDDTSGLKDFVFTHSNLDSFNLTENSVLKSIHGRIVGNPEEGIQGLLLSSTQDDTGIMSLTMMGRTSEFSINFIKTLYEKLSNFYVSKTIEKQKQTYIITRSKADSIQTALYSAQNQLLKFQDSNRNLSLRQYAFEKLKYERQSQSLAYAYGEALKNQEIADFALKSRTPFIQPIDLPIAPISPNKNLSTYIKNLIIGGFLGGFLSVAFILGRRIFKDVMEES